MIVLDSSAVLALLFNEPGASRVASALADSWLSAVNLSEVLAVVRRRGKDPQQILDEMLEAPVTIVPFDITVAMLAADLEAPTRVFGLSLGDRACLALALERVVSVLTADRAWAQLALPVRVELIR